MHTGDLAVLGSDVDTCLRHLEMALRIAQPRPPGGGHLTAEVLSVGTPVPSGAPAGRVQPSQVVPSRTQLNPWLLP